MQTTIFFFIKKKVTLFITLTALVFVSVLLALAHQEGQLTNFSSVGKVLVPWATVIGVIGAIIVAFSALKTYKSNNSIEKWKIIKGIYDAFLEKEWYDFYKKIQSAEQKIDLEKDEKLLNDTLTLFDDLEYYQAQGLLDEEAWMYFACELQNFALNDRVWEYIDKSEKPYLEKGFHKDIIPFTGFPALLDKLPKKFKAKWPPQLEERLIRYREKNKNNASKWWCR